MDQLKCILSSSSGINQYRYFYSADCQIYHTSHHWMGRCKVLPQDWGYRTTCGQLAKKCLPPVHIELEIHLFYVPEQSWQQWHMYRMPSETGKSALV